METSAPSNSSPPQPQEEALKQRLQDLKDLFEGAAWHLYQEELVKVKRRALEAVVRTRSSEDRDYYLSMARGIDLVLSPNFSEGALQDAGQPIDNPDPPPHPMSLDSEGKRALAASRRPQH